jgi:hypothetical protein
MSGSVSAKNPDDMLRDSWSKASRMTLSATLALFLLSRGAKTGANKLLEVLGLDWSALNPYAVGLFGVPVVAALCFWSLWWASAFARRHVDKPWYKRVATKTDLDHLGDRASTVAGMSLFIFAVLPIVGLMALEGKFLNGAFYYSSTGSFSCPDGCTQEDGFFSHLSSAEGWFQSVLNTPFRYYGNLTYLPPWQGIIWIALGLGVLIYAAFYARLLFHREQPRATSAKPG